MIAKRFTIALLAATVLLAAPFAFPHERHLLVDMPVSFQEG